MCETNSQRPLPALISATPDHNGSLRPQQYLYHSSEIFMQSFGPSGTRETWMSKTPRGSRISTCRNAQIKGDKSTTVPTMSNFLARIIRTRQMGLGHMDHSKSSDLKTFQARRLTASR